MASKCTFLLYIYYFSIRAAGKIHMSEATKSALDANISSISSSDAGFDVELRGPINVKVRRRQLFVSHLTPLMGH